MKEVTASLCADQSQEAPEEMVLQKKKKKEAPEMRVLLWTPTSHFCYLFVIAHWVSFLAKKKKHNILGIYLSSLITHIFVILILESSESCRKLQIYDL